MILLISFTVMKRIDWPCKSLEVYEKSLLIVSDIPILIRVGNTLSKIHLCKLLAKRFLKLSINNKAFIRDFRQEFSFTSIPTEQLSRFIGL